MLAPSKQSMFVAVEYGGQWPLSLHAEAGVDLVVVAQLADEDPQACARRLLTKIVSLIGRGADIVSAVFAVAPLFGIRQLESRCTIARALLRALRPGSNGELCLIEPKNATRDCRAHLLAIAEGVMEHAATDPLIRLGYDSHRTRAIAIRRFGA